MISVMLENHSAQYIKNDVIDYRIIRQDLRHLAGMAPHSQVKVFIFVSYTL